MSGGWGRADEPDLAVERILDAAGKAFAERGVSAAGMAEIAQTAGCSRGTLYRYFESRHELHVAYVEREAVRISERVRAAIAGIADPGERLAEGILVSIREVRADPGTAAWFDPGTSAMTARMSRSLEIVDAITTRFAEGLLGPGAGAPDGRLLARWLVRVIVSLLSAPGEDAEEERALVERFVAPVLSRAPRR